jgi:hypothetical protein
VLGLSGGAVRALESHDPDGSGPLPARLYAGGDFGYADGLPSPHLACWDGVSWRNVAGSGGVLGAVRALKSWDDGNGSALYVGGDQLPGGSYRLVWKLTQTGWEALPLTTSVGLNQRVDALEVHDDGTGAKLYAAGLMLPFSGKVKVLAGGAWQTVVAAPREVRSLRSVPELGALIAGELCIGARDAPLLRAWPDQSVCAISPVWDDGHGPTVVLGGEFLTLRESFSPLSMVVGTPYLAGVSACDRCYANCDGSTAAPVLNVLDFNCFLNRFAAGEPYANCDGSTAAPVLNVLDFNCFLNRFGAGCP